MNPIPFRSRLARNRRRQHGYASMAMVAVIGIISLIGMLVVFRDASRSHDSEARSQIRIDYTQKEDAFLRGIVSLLPNKADPLFHGPDSPGLLRPNLSSNLGTDYRGTVIVCPGGNYESSYSLLVVYKDI